MRAERAPAFGRQADDLRAAVGRRRRCARPGPVRRRRSTSPVTLPFDTIMRCDEFAERHAVRRLVELRHQVEARQRHVEAVAQAAAHFAFDQRRAGQKAQPQPQLGLVIGRALGDLGFRIERDERVSSIRFLRPRR